MDKSESISKKLIAGCPFCGDDLRLSRLTCRRCQTQIDTIFEIPPFFRLPPELQEFVMIFLRCQGKIRDVEKVLGISYPTVCKRLDLVNEFLGNHKPGLNGHPQDRQEILTRLERGEITVKEATRLLKEQAI